MNIDYISGEYLKKCSICKQEKFEVDFASDPDALDGLSDLCEECGKTCNRCGKTLPRTEYTKNCNTPDGLSYYCKKCVHKQKKEDYSDKNYHFKRGEDRSISISQHNNIVAELHDHYNDELDKLRK